MEADGYLTRVSRSRSWTTQQNGKVLPVTSQAYYPVLKEQRSFNLIQSGGYSEEATPVPIPNTEVKLFSADGSWGLPPVRVGRCQAPGKRAAIIVAVLFLYMRKNFSESFYINLPI